MCLNARMGEGCLVAHAAEGEALRRVVASYAAREVSECECMLHATWTDAARHCHVSCLAVHVAEREEVRRLLDALYCVHAQVAAHHLPESPVAGPFRCASAVRDGLAAGQCRRRCV